MRTASTPTSVANAIVKLGYDGPAASRRRAGQLGTSACPAFAAYSAVGRARPSGTSSSAFIGPAECWRICGLMLAGPLLSFTQSWLCRFGEWQSRTCTDRHFDLA
jgi:hypothetical protein